MKKLREEKGMAMVEVVLVIMIFTILASSLYGLAGMENRRVMRNISEEEAYYAAVSAVRLMEKEVTSGEIEAGLPAYELIAGDGMKKRGAEICFEPDEPDGEGKAVRIPVEIWSERHGDELLLAARAEVHGVEKVVTMTLEKQKLVVEEEEDESEGTRTASPSEPEEALESAEVWVPVSYGFDLGN